MFHWRKFRKNGKKNASMEETLKRIGKNMPKDYIDFLKKTNGGVGEIRHSYIELWSVEDIERNHADYAVEEFLPGIILIGSNGSGLAYGIDMRQDSAVYIKVPFMDMDFAEVNICGRNMAEFFRNLES